MMRLFPQKVVLICAALGFAACKAETGATLQILDAPQVETDCTLSATPTHFQARGLYDPTGGASYLQLIYLQNNALESGSTLGGGNTVNGHANDANIIGYDTCFYRADDPRVVAWKPDGKGLIIDCDKVPANQRLFIPSSGTVTSGGGTLAAYFDVLGDAQLQSLYGAAWDSTALTGDPRNTASRAGAWGDFPASFASEIVLQFRARAKGQGGHTVRSNWFSFPVVVEPGFAAAPCPPGQAPASGACDIASGQPFTCASVTP
jgi:hypothetical protein